MKIKVIKAKSGREICTLEIDAALTVKDLKIQISKQSKISFSDYSEFHFLNIFIPPGQYFDNL